MLKPWYCLSVVKLCNATTFEVSPYQSEFFYASRKFDYGSSSFAGVIDQVVLVKHLELVLFCFFCCRKSVVDVLTFGPQRQILCACGYLVPTGVVLTNVSME